MDVHGGSEKRRLYLRVGIKLLVAVGFAFLLVPFVSSLPWPRQTLPAGSVLLPHLFHQSINAWAEAVPALPRFSHTTVPLAISAALLIAANR